MTPTNMAHNKYTVYMYILSLTYICTHCGIEYCIVGYFQPKLHISTVVEGHFSGCVLQSKPLDL